MSEPEAEVILRLEGVTRTFGAVTAVDRLSLDVRRGEFLTLLGPSGCGKTTALRLIAGFDRPDDGRIVFRGEDVSGWSPQERGFGMVFQNYALFPHLDVFENVAFGLRARKVARDRIRDRVAAALASVDLEGYGDRAVQALSGGQQQRVALARALAIEPPLLLLDEPLSNLDQALRLQTRNELRRLVKALGITAVFVTHDQEEAFDLSDRIAVMQAGALHQVGSPRVLYDEPVDPFVAGFVGRANRLAVEVERGAVRLSSGVRWPPPGGKGGEGPLRAPGQVADGPATLIFRPEGLRLAAGSGESGELDPLPGVVRDRRFQGGAVVYHVEVEGLRAGAAEPGPIVEVSGPVQGPDVGDRVSLRAVPHSRIHLFSDERDGSEGSDGSDGKR